MQNKKNLSFFNLKNKEGAAITPPPVPTPIFLLYLILFFSGFAGLGYELVWTRMLAVGLGHEIPAVLAVVAAFFCGLALGAWVLDRGKPSVPVREPSTAPSRP